MFLKSSTVGGPCDVTFAALAKVHCERGRRSKYIVIPVTGTRYVCTSFPIILKLVASSCSEVALWPGEVSDVEDLPSTTQVQHFVL